MKADCYQRLAAGVLLISLFLPVQARAQVLFESYEAFTDSLRTLAQITDASEREAGLSVLWDSLRTNDQIPYRQGDKAAFLYRGSASSIGFPGDHNQWDWTQTAATRLGNSDIWMAEITLPEDARVDYKIVRNGSEWILDPENPFLQRGGFGDNSELRMPAYQPSPWVLPRAGNPRGGFTTNNSIESTFLGYSVNYRVYIPDGYDAEQLSDVPVVYVTDGHEYADDLLGSMRLVLDNLIEDNLIEPLLAVFIDPRVNGQNLRGEQYIENPDFARFIADELVPEIDRSYRTNPDRRARGILGTSLGGLNSAYVGALETETFYNIGIQSPAFHAGPTIYDLYSNEIRRDIRIHMSWGTINDIGVVGQTMASILARKGYPYETLIMNEGHSWGLWRATLDEVLIYFWGTGGVDVSTEDYTSPDAFELGPNYPNPFSQSTSIPFTLNQPGHVKLTIYDMLGRAVAVLIDEIKAAGAHTVQWDASDLPNGVYYGRIDSENMRSEVRAFLHID